MESLKLSRSLWFPGLLILLVAHGALSLTHARGLLLQSAPTAKFDWSVPERFGPTGSDGLINYHWNPANQTYSSEFINPSTWPVNFDACALGDPAGIKSYIWEIQGESIVRESCKFTYNKFRFLGTYTVKLTVTTHDGQSNSTQQDITLKDFLIVSVGDSFASGQGNPDIERANSSDGKAAWIYQRCHRSAQAGPAQAALRIENADPHTSVTFISYACSGAGITDGVITEQKKGSVKLAPQIRKVRTATAGRKIDALLISVGGNDAHFASLVALTIALPDASRSSLANDLFGKDWELSHQASSCCSIKSQLCLRAPKFSSRSIRNLRAMKTERLATRNPTTTSFSRRFSFPEAEWASNTVITNLNLEVQRAATKHGWVYVDNIATKTVKHGYCAGEERWVRTFRDAEHVQGRTDCHTVRECLISSGSMHPNGKAHACFATRMIQAMQTKGVIPFAVPNSPDDPCAAP